MKHQQHRSPVQLVYDELKACFRKLGFDKIRPNQDEALKCISKQSGHVTIEAPTGTGKTALGISYLKALEKRDIGPLYYIVPNKTNVDEIKNLYPELKVAYGRGEHDCLYYKDEKLKADEVPCSLLHDCVHRVSLKTGETHEFGAKPCSYLKSKWESRQGGIVVCTASFYLFNFLFSSEENQAGGLVIDEVHQLAKIFRNALSYEITDYHLKRAIELLSEVTIKESEILSNFLRKMNAIIKSKPAYAKTLLEADEISELIDELAKIDPVKLEQKISEAIKRNVINPKADRETLKKVEIIINDLARYIKSFEYSLLIPGKRQPLNYSYGFYEADPSEDKRVKYKLVIKCYYVAPLIKKILAPNTLSMSATIGDPQVLKFETGIKAPFYSFGSDFPVENVKIIIPTDTPDLSVKARKRQDLTKTLRRIAISCRKLADKGLRSLVVVVSEKERQKFLMLAQEEKVNTISYGDGVKPREAVKLFKQGKSDVLVGTIANYGEGIDLPDGQAPVIFFLRPAYPSPNDPMTAFEERRYGSMRWAIWNWRVMIEALQVRGRNQRSALDLGVTIFVSQQFRRFLKASLPKWLQSAYVRDLTLDQAVQSAAKMLKVYQEKV